MRSGSRRASSSCVERFLLERFLLSRSLPDFTHAQSARQVLGACILLSWNTTIVAGSYYGARLAGSPFEASFASFNALTFTTANLVFLAHANATQGKVRRLCVDSPSTSGSSACSQADLSRRISWSILVLAANLALFIISTKVKKIPPALFFAFLIVSSIILAASASYLQNAVVALSASFGPSYLNQILSGQGAIGFAVAMIQFVAAYGAVKNAPKEPSHDLVLIEDNSTFTSLLGNPLLVARAAAAPPEPVRQSAFTFFLTVGLFAAASFVCYIVLIRLPLYRLVIRASFDSDAQPNKPKDASSSSDSGVSLRVVERKVRHLGVAMFLVFGITLAVFPSITSTIVSVKSDDPDARILQRSELFVPLGFAVFAGGDWLGRVLPQWDKLAWTNWKALMACSIGRVVFVVRVTFLSPKEPLLTLSEPRSRSSSCATRRPAARAAPSSTLISVRRSPCLGGVLHSHGFPLAAFFAIMLVFAVTNGYFSTLIMLASVVEPSLEQDEVEVRPLAMARALKSEADSGLARRSPPPASPFTSRPASPSARSSRSASAAPFATVTPSSSTATALAITRRQTRLAGTRLLISLAPLQESPDGRLPRSVRIVLLPGARPCLCSFLAFSAYSMLPFAACRMTTRPRPAAARAAVAPAAAAAATDGGACGTVRAWVGDLRHPPRAQADRRTTVRQTSRTRKRCAATLTLLWMRTG